MDMRSGIIGTGFIGGVHAYAIRAAGGVLAHVAGESPEHAAAAARRLGAENACASVEELINADDVDVVHVCTPNALHVPQAEAAIRAGKHVICEKPLATDPADARRLVEAAADAGVVAAVPFVYRFYPSVREARARIGAGDAGPLWLLHGSYLQDWLAGAGESKWRVDPALGGASRAFGDIGVHWCDLAEFVTGQRITRVAARTANAHPVRDGQTAATEDGAVVIFATDQGATGSVTVSQVTPGRKNRLWFSFDGTEASYSFDQEAPDTLWVGGRSENRVVLRGPDTLGPAAGAYATLPAGHPQGYADSFTAFVADVYAAVNGEPPDGLPTFADGHRAAVITEAVVAAARTDSWVEVPA